MAFLNDEHIAYIRKDLHYRGIVLDDIDNELVDHICSAVEVHMEAGDRFIDAYHKVLHSFGHNRGLRNIQRQTSFIKGQTSIDMFRSYLTIAIRNLKKYPLFTCINVAGLAAGIAACVLIVLFVINEYRYDRHHENADRVYRVNGKIRFNGEEFTSSRVPWPLASAVVAEFPEVEKAVHLSGSGLFFVKHGEALPNVAVTNVTFSTNDAFRIFSIPFAYWDPTTALRDPNTVVISESTARNLFGGESPIDQPLVLDNHLNVKVVGVYKDMPSTSHFHFNMIVSEVGSDFEEDTAWVNDNLLPRRNMATYVLLNKGSDWIAFDSKLNTLVEKYIRPEVPAAFSDNETSDARNTVEFSAQSLTDIHFGQDLALSLEPGFSREYLYVLITIAGFILIIASINFVNLSTARSANRAKEVGMRKVMGSLKIYLVRQFLTESIVMSSIAFAVGVGLAFAFLPLFNLVSARNLSIPYNEPTFYVAIIGSMFVIGLFAGLYPSFFLSGFRPVQVLKGQISQGMKSGFVRSTLVIFQFSISIFLVIGSIVLFRQLDYIHNKNLGFVKEQVIAVEETYLLGDKKQLYLSEALKNPVFTSGTISGFLPAGGPWRFYKTWWPEGKSMNDGGNVIQNWWVGHDYLKTLGMHLKSGREFSREIVSDSTGVIVNEAAAKQLGLGTDAVGKTVTTYRGTDPSRYAPDRTKTFTVIGVVEDFHFESMKESIGPLILELSSPSAGSGSIVLRFQAEKTSEAIAALEDQWKLLAPAEPFSYSFLNERFNKIYEAEGRLGKIFGAFTAIAILIACLGSFALISFTTERRTKEIGIRKVMGASVTTIVLLLSKEFGKLILIAFLISAPLAWYATQWWLNSYTYRIDVGLLVFFLSGVLSFLVAWLTIGFQSVRAANANPVKALRSE